MSNGKWDHDRYDDAFEAIKLVAKAKMVMNYHKGDIASCPTDVLINSLSSEIAELQDAVAGEDIMHVIEEAADVFNFLVALTHQQIEKYRHRKGSNSDISKMSCTCLAKSGHKKGSKGCLFEEHEGDHDHDH